MFKVGLVILQKTPGASAISGAGVIISKGGGDTYFLKSTTKVLVVGGEPAERQVIADSLSHTDTQPWAIEWAETPQECVELLRSEAFDLLMVDERLLSRSPGASLGHIQAIAPRLPVFILSTEADENRALEYISLGAADFMPFEDCKAEGVLRKSATRVVQRAISQVQLVNQISDLVLTNAFDGAAAFDLHYRILLWNPAMERMFGLKRKEVLGKVASEVAPLLYGHGEEESFLDALAGRNVTSALREFEDESTGNVVHFQSFYSPLTSSQGRVVGAVALVRDLTEPRKAHREIRDLEDRLLKVADAIPKIVWWADAAGNRRFFNRKWSELTGENQVHGDSVAGQWRERIHPQDQARVLMAWTKATAEHRSLHVQYRIRRADGQYRVVLDSGSPQFDGEGKLSGYLGFCTDIGETRLTQTRMKASVASRSVREQTGTLDHAPIGVWKLDQNLIITKANPAVAAQLGMDPEMLVGLPFNQVVSSLPQDTFNPVLRQSQRIQMENQPIVVGLGEQQKNVFWDLSIWPLKDTNNQVIGVCVSTMEVTERQKEHQQREDFIATLVHDLKTPLIGADRTLECMVNGALGEVDNNQAEVLNMLRRSNQSLLTMVQNLIEVHRYELDKPNLTCENIDCFELVSDCVREMSAAAEHKGLCISSSLPFGLGTVYADRLAIRRVFFNLVDNAIKFTPNGGIIKVFGEEADGYVTIHVRDTGIGMSEQDKKHIFERFWQSERGKRTAVGTGLGLFLCNQIVTAHGGQIRVESKENDGTTFSIKLPCRKDEVA